MIKFNKFIYLSDRAVTIKDALFRCYLSKSKGANDMDQADSIYLGDRAITTRDRIE